MITRQVGALVLGQLGISPERRVPPFWQEQVLELMTLLNRETVGQNDPEVLKDTCISLGHLNDVRAVPPLVKLKRHRDGRVRYGVAFGLTGHDDPRAIEALIELAGDFDPQVREWATFALARVIQTEKLEKSLWCTTASSKTMKTCARLCVLKAMCLSAKRIRK